MTALDFPNSFKKRFNHTSSFSTGTTFMIFDCIGVMLCVGAAFFTVNAVDKTLIRFRDFVDYWVYLPAFAAAFFAARLYPGIMLQPAEEVRRFTLTSFFCFTGIALSIAVETDGREALSVALFLAVPFAAFILPLMREAVRTFFCRFNWWGIPVVIYASEKNKHIITDRLLNKHSFGYKPAAIISSDAAGYSEYKTVPVFPYSEEIEKSVHACKITTAIVMEESERLRVKTPLNSLLSEYRYIITIPYSQSLKFVSLSVRDFGGILGFSASNRLTRMLNLFFKRCIDLALLLIFSPLIVPLILLISILVKCTSKGPIFYGHKRIGKNGKQITTWKFRSMVMDADKRLKELLEKNPALKREWEENQKLEHDPRITGIGKLLRKTSLDELPQFFNILIGQMSFVGPRPVVEAERKKYGDKFDYIFSVTPGLSGMWQISGRSSTGYDERIMLDTFYIQNWSIWLDIWIILQTFVVVVTGKGAY
ncbi:undecaprenyl-phosphate galactose phosphotransferase WbaP [Treponema sp. OMZ 840]|uniref:undecaprenyl-phosphate galactose phosphotransferase WbaP n=1 Tax=Treponema sp. OMZ 840 TaxID=244313 RepID=UPI003D91BA72